MVALAKWYITDSLFYDFKHYDGAEMAMMWMCHLIAHYFRLKQPLKGALAIRRIFSLVDMITKPLFSNCPNVFKIGLFR